jgi:hypothetical protein
VELALQVRSRGAEEHGVEGEEGSKPAASTPMPVAIFAAFTAAGQRAVAVRYRGGGDGALPEVLHTEKATLAVWGGMASVKNSSELAAAAAAGAAPPEVLR